MIVEALSWFTRSALHFWRVNLKIVPVRDIAAAPQTGGFRWVVTGEKPRFRIRLWRPAFGWLLVNCQMRHSFPNPTPRIIFNSSDGQIGNGSCDLVPYENGNFEALVYAPRLARGLQFSPNDGLGEFALNRFSVFNIPAFIVRIFGVFILSRHHPRFRGHNARWVLRFLREESRRENISFDRALERQYQALVEQSGSRSYESWIHTVEQLGRARQPWSGAGARDAPLISILLPVFDPLPRYLEECLESVLAQEYANWELCVVDDASESEEIRRLLADYAARDQRIRVTHRPENGHICVASNDALGMARGEFVALLDHDDRLSRDALLCVAEALRRRPRPRLIYSDEDKIDENGRRFGPHFKSDWNPDLLYAQNYINHLCVFESVLIRRAGGFRPGFEGSQDHDLLLRATRDLGENEICHIPHVLYSWRITGGSTSYSATAKSNAWDAGLRAVSSFFDSDGAHARVTKGQYPFTYRLHWRVPDPQPLVSIIIPTRDNAKLLRVCLESILQKTEYKNFEIIVVDNGSSERAAIRYLDSLEKENEVHVLPYPGPFNYSAINNTAVRQSSGEVVALLNDDVEVISPRWLTEMASNAIRPEIGCVGAKLLYPGGTIQHAGVICGIGGIAGHSHKHVSAKSVGYILRLVLPQNISAVTGACLVVRRMIWDELGGLNERALPVAYNDVDFCLRVREAGYRNLWTPFATLYHHESASRGLDDPGRNRDRSLMERGYMKQKWKNYLDRDPYYNPHLTLEKEDFSFSEEMRQASGSTNKHTVKTEQE